jgi:hypothetical protein
VQRIKGGAGRLFSLICEFVGERLARVELPGHVNHTARSSTIDQERTFGPRF